LGAGGFNGFCRPDNLISTFHGTWAGDDYGTSPFADFHAVDLDYRRPGVKVPGHHLVRFGDMNHFLDAGEVADGNIIHISFIAQDANGRSFRSGNRRRRQPHLFNRR
jgi:hypothetical protein